MVGRLVGFYEYANALDNLDRLVNLVSPSELAEIDKIVAEKDEFTVYTNLSRRLQRGPSSLGNAEAETQSDKYERRGLAWTMALARVELAAMLACFTRVPQPFEAVGPTDFDRAAYVELIQDGAKSHYWALVNDPMLESVTHMRADQVPVLSYSRRLVLARAILGAAMRAGIKDYSPAQMSELTSWKDSLDKLQAGFVLKIEQFLETVRSTLKLTNKASNNYVEACGALLRSEQREISAGRATTERYP
jgi:hypothetical protein